MSLSVLIVSEGKHELGDTMRRGSLPILVQRVVGAAVQILPTCMKISNMPARVHPGKGDRLTRKLIGILRYAEAHSFDAAVIVIDEDNDGTRHKLAAEAQDSMVFGVRRAIGIAVRSYDAWFLADNAALSNVLEMPVALQPAPEQNKDPKQTCRNFRDTSDLSLPLHELYARLALFLSVETLQKRCPRGFEPFAERLRNML